PEYIMYLTVLEPKTWDNNFYATVVNPVLEEAMSMGDTLDTSVSEGSEKTEETSYQTGDIIGKSPGETTNTLRQNLIHPIVLGVGDKIEKVSVDAKANIKANEQILIMTNDFTELPDMYGWTKKNVETFAKWKGIKITYKGGKSGTVTKQSVAAGKALSKTKKITITLGD
ncbi:MAG: PASTA domain-containing protein, partial [Streptococcus sp.]|nr:PASTA domain-containing protein [Streptococcus sp.]